MKHLLTHNYADCQEARRLGLTCPGQAGEASLGLPHPRPLPVNGEGSKGRGKTVRQE